MRTRNGFAAENGGNGGNPSASRTFLVTDFPPGVVTTVVGGGGGGGKVVCVPIDRPDEIETAPDPFLPRIRSTAPTMWLSPVSRLNQAIGRRKSIATVLLAPRSDPSALFIRVGASSTSQTTKQRIPIPSARRQLLGIRFRAPSPGSALGTARSWGSVGWSGPSAPRVDGNSTTDEPARPFPAVVRSTPDLPSAAPLIAAGFPPAGVRRLAAPTGDRRPS
jgi:hypothetical protein